MEARPDLAEQAKLLPDVTGATMARDDYPSGILIYTRSDHGLDRVGFAPLVGPAVRLSPLEALRVTACTPETEPKSPIENQYELIDSIVEGPLTVDEFNPETHLTGIRRRTWERVMTLIDREEAGRLFDPDADAREAIAALRSGPLTEQAKQTLARALRERTPQDVLALVVQLFQDGRLNVSYDGSDDELHIICSMGIVGEAT
jgi:hypothetical protein